MKLEYQPVPWLLVALMVACTIAINTAAEATDKVHVKPLFVQITAFMEKVDYGAAVIALLFLGILIIYYAHLSWLYLIVLAVTTACELTTAKSVESQRSPEVRKNIMIITLSMAVSLLGLAVFAWIK